LFKNKGANILLQRLMTQNNINEPFSLFGFDSEINPCLVSYKPIDTRIVKVEDEDFPVQGIERTIESMGELPTTWQVYFAQDGHMINRVQVGYPAIMKSVIKPKSIEVDEYMPKIVIEKRGLVVDNDMEMKSKLLDRKVWTDDFVWVSFGFGSISIAQTQRPKKTKHQAQIQTQKLKETKSQTRTQTPESIL
jgi:hypothetical protein